MSHDAEGDRPATYKTWAEVSKSVDRTSEGYLRARARLAAENGEGVR